MLSDQALLRYSRHILLPEIDLQGQLALSKTKILIVGCGGLGCVSALYLAASGIGHIHLIDYDQIEISNLQRQIAYTQDQLNLEKAACLAQRLQQLNSSIRVTYDVKRATQAYLLERLPDFHLVLDGSDNFETRFLVNRLAFQQGVPLISAAVVGFKGHVMAVSKPLNTACYACLFSELADDSSDTCHASGVFSPLVGVIGGIQATEALKVSLGFGDTLMGQLLTIDGRVWQQKKFTLQKDPACSVCT